MNATAGVIAWLCELAAIALSAAPAPETGLRFAVKLGPHARASAHLWVDLANFDGLRLGLGSVRP